jgi:acetoin utilization deacetylase AcuC-like enzyme
MNGASLPVFFTPQMVARSSSYSPSAHKPAAVVASWQAKGIPIRMMPVLPASASELATAHHPNHVRSILACEAENGFGNKSQAVAASLPFTTGSMLSAARWVVAHGGVASAPCSGFHHARFRQVGGYCTFNGLMVTACVLRAEGRVQRVGIIDCDMHYGDGTDQIIEVLDAHRWVRHFTAGLQPRSAADADRFLAELPSIVDEMADCDLVMYQAGADPHVDDPLGGWLTSDQLRQRDAIVFDRLRTLERPVVWNLAGGYQQEPDGSIPRVLEIHDNTAHECVRAFGGGG